MTIDFLAPLMLLLLPLGLIPLHKGRPSALPASSLEIFSGLRSGWREKLARLQPPAAILGLLLLITALSEPVLEKATPVTLRRGVNLMLAVDVSASMQADDIKPTRMQVARKAAADFVRKRQDDNVGIILFSGVPFLLSPPTDNPAPVVDRLLQIKPDRIGSGTAIGDALAAATARLPLQQANQSAVVLLTDGRSNRGRITPLAAARAAAALGIRVYTIGFGSQEGAYLPAQNGRPAQKVVLDETPLKTIAALTDGQYFRATGAAELEQVYDRINRLEKADLELSQQIDRTPLQPLLLRLVALLIGLELTLFRMLLRRIP